MKKLAKSFIVAILGWQVRRLRKRFKFQTVAVAGSIGKTSTKFAVATVLSQSFNVRWQKGNYNDTASIPLVFFGLSMPSLFNPIAWLITFIKIEIQLTKNFPYDVVVVEVGTDYPGNIAKFKRYLKADLGILTAITPEHMQFFPDLDAVANEELTIAELSEKLLVNTDLCPEKYLDKLKDYTTYGVHKDADYQLDYSLNSAGGYDFEVNKNKLQLLKESRTNIVETQLFSITAAVAAADMLGARRDSIIRGIDAIQPVNGRMRRLRGIQDSTILDDTYNSSPEATKAALDTVYKIDAPQKIALLGNMNELGIYSEQAHLEIGAYCNPKFLDLVVTIGPDANQFLAAAAEQSGCEVVRTDTPYKAAEEIAKRLQPGALILAKGSQNKVFAEEAVKILLADSSDVRYLVRQDKHWLKTKFNSIGAP